MNNLKLIQKCSNCNGTGYEYDETYMKELLCSACWGQGYIPTDLGWDIFEQLEIIKKFEATRQQYQ